MFFLLLKTENRDILPFQSSFPPLKPIWAQVAVGTYPSLLNLRSKLFIRAPPATLLKHILLRNIFFVVNLHSKLFIRAPPATLLKHILLQNILKFIESPQ